MMACYRSASMLMHAPIAMSDAARAFAAGQFANGLALLFQRGVAQSIGALINEIPRRRREARRHKAAATTAGPTSPAEQPRPAPS
jgi:hypothetical protein